jgi:hypothetical protein
MHAGLSLAIVAAIFVACTPSSVTPTPNPTTSAPAAIVATPAPSGKGTWIADTGIYGTNFHFGPPGYICGVGFNLSYGGGAPLVSVDVGVLFADAFAMHVTPSSAGRVIGWQHPIMQIASPTAIHDAAWLSQRGDAVGAECQNGPSDLDSLRGTILKVNWETVEGSYEQEFRIVDIRGEMTLFGMPDGRTRVCWALPAGC